MHSKDEDETEGDVLFFAITHILLTESNTKNKLVKERKKILKFQFQEDN